MNPGRPLEIANATTIATVGLAAVASWAGAFVPGLYAEDALAAAMRGQDVATLIVLPLLLIVLHRMKRGSPRATVVWLGLLGYLLYTSAGAALAYRFNSLFLVHVAVFSLSAISVWTALSGIHRARAAPAIAPSARLDAWLPDAPFRDTIVVESPAPAPRLMQALEEVTLREMPLASLLGRIRYLPALFGSKDAARRAHLELDRPFVAGVTSGRGQLFLGRGPDEIVVGTVGKLHQLRDQEFAEVATTADFATFAQPNHERLAMSIRAIPSDHGTLLALEHRTQPTDAAARRRFARYWLAIRPGGAFVTRQLLKAVARRAERGAAATGSTTHLSN